jgi:predicted transposase/invertase (TIGR01784 family)
MNEHDKLFKEIISVKENAADLICSTFPAEVLAELDLDTLTLDNNSYVDKKLKEHFADLVYTCKSSNKKIVTISLLFEHKSSKPNNEYLQLLRYMINIWSYQEKNKLELSVVIPVIFYHGRAKWVVKPFTEKFSAISENFCRFIPDFDYILTDIIRYDDETIKNKLFKREFNRVLVLLFKYIHNEKLLTEKLYEILIELKDHIDHEKDDQSIISILAYILLMTKISSERVKEVVHQVSDKGGQIIMTTGMKLIEKGKREGITESKMETARKMLKDGLSDSVISKYTGLSEKEIASIKL